MQDATFYTSMLLASVALAQVQGPEFQSFKELSATVMLGILFWYTLTRINTGLTKLTETIQELNSLIQKRIQEVEHEKENS